MNKSLLKDLQKLAKKHNLELSESCLYCGHEHENLDIPKCGDSFMVSFTETKPQE